MYFNPINDPGFMFGNILGSLWRQNYDNRGAANEIQKASDLQGDISQYNQYSNVQNLLNDWQTARSQYENAPTEADRQVAAQKGSLVRDSLYKLGFDPNKFNANTDPQTLTGAYQTTMDKLNALNQKNAGNKGWSNIPRMSQQIGKVY